MNNSRISEARLAVSFIGTKRETRCMRTRLWIGPWNLIDLTLTDKRWRSRWMEIARLREALCDRFASNRTLEISLKSLEDYFLVFAPCISS